MPKAYKIGEHPYRDEQLCTGKDLAASFGVTTAAISKAKSSGRLSTFQNSEGKWMFYKPVNQEEFYKNRNPSKVTTATIGQKAQGLTDLGARVIAQQRPAFTKPVPGDGLLSEDEVVDFAESRARREKYNADLARMKAEEQAGTLVDKVAAGNRVKELATSVKDRLLTIHIRVAAETVGELEKALVAAGFEEAGVRSAFSANHIENVIGESVRKGVVESLRDIVKKEIEGFL